MQARVQASLRAGWLVARLHGPVLDRPAGGTTHHLPSSGELTVDQQVELALGELRGALMVTGAGAACLDCLVAVGAVPRSGTWHAAFKAALEDLHVRLLIDLTEADPRLGRGYGLGRSLCDTAWQPDSAADLGEYLNAYRVAELDSWLSGLTSVLDHDAVAAVRGSLLRWSQWAATPLIDGRPLDWVRDGRVTQQALRHQGATWHHLLSGERDPRSLLTPEDYVAAAGAAVRRVRSLACHVLGHFWWAFVFVLVVAASLAYASDACAAGTAKLWGLFVAALGGSGALLAGVRTGVTRLTRRAAAPLWRIELDDALAIGATRLPPGASTRSAKPIRSAKSTRPAKAPHGSGPGAPDSPGLPRPAASDPPAQPEEG